MGSATVALRLRGALQTIDAATMIVAASGAFLLIPADFMRRPENEIEVKHSRDGIRIGIWHTEGRLVVQNWFPDVAPSAGAAVVSTIRSDDAPDA